MWLQVKQQKKSSNKWSCVVCNQKQSVRKVFAQSAMARDVRKFVQNFNMSRQFSDQKQSFSDEFESFDFQSEERTGKRSDWSEYVDDQDEYGGKFDKDEGDNGLEPMVVTEFPKALFKKPKLKDYSSNGYGSQKMFKPNFPSRRNSERQRNENSQDTQSQMTEFEQISCERASKKSDYSNEEHSSSHPSDRAPKWNRFKAQVQDDHSKSTNNMEKTFVRQPRNGVEGSISKWDDYITQEGEDNNAIGIQMGRLHHTTAAKGPASKWSSFISEEDDDDDNDDILGSGRTIDSMGRVSDEKVDDDIHPDFL
ncbi:hypothetical protein PHJA_002004600 [Phtheirospermum japonicum]|uniref:MRN complex-interacting protein N-terminal domain-containing protein n=1 Tax=Phtheirospermum japonicum TaxID=374723 RepID=A0A830CCX7_9LAMI|nr:hypothetical protein PHJA_002004600 [Phtheirospermum japonicum]